MIINGTDITSMDDVKIFLESSGMDVFDIEDFLSVIYEDYESHLDHGTKEGLLGDDYYIAAEAIEGDIRDIQMECEYLERPSRKGYTRADIADRLRTIANNLEVHKDACQIYEV